MWLDCWKILLVRPEKFVPGIVVKKVNLPFELPVSYLIKISWLHLSLWKLVYLTLKQLHDCCGGGVLTFTRWDTLLSTAAIDLLSDSHWIGLFKELRSDPSSSRGCVGSDASMSSHSGGLQIAAIVRHPTPSGRGWPRVWQRAICPCCLTRACQRARPQGCVQHEPHEQGN